MQGYFTHPLGSHHNEHVPGAGRLYAKRLQTKTEDLSSLNRDSFSLGRAALNFQFLGRPQLTREDNLKFYDTVTRQGVDLPQFSQSETMVQLARQGSETPPSSLLIQVGQDQGKFRFLVAEEWPSSRSLELIGKDADIAWDSFHEVWPSQRVGGNPVLVEVNLKTTAMAKGGDATGFLRDSCLHLNPAAFEKLERQPHGLGLTIMLPVQIPSNQGTDIPLMGAGSTIRVETLLDDPTRLYIQAQFSWPSVPIPQEIRQKIGGGPERTNPELRRPSEYLLESDEYVKTQLTDFLLASAGPSPTAHRG